ncbi:sensor histidine kinase [Plantactinospora sp. WMMB782]|uniref:sensor histidine kinase n=1 Tax=Plantactinospora sp. WMMB782 TaxID=3404121 RepID=UPI003B93C158
MPWKSETARRAAIRTIRRRRLPEVPAPGPSLRRLGRLLTARLSQLVTGRLLAARLSQLVTGGGRYPGQPAAGGRLAELVGSGRTAAVPGPAAPAGPPLLLRTFCHELRSPIESLRALTRALAEEPARLSADERREVAELAQEQVAHLACLWRRTTSVLQSLAEPVDRPVPLSQVLPVALAAGTPHRLTVRLSHGAGDRLVPAHRVRQILVNLVDNALRHGPADGRVRVSASVCAGRLVLVVADEGRSCRAVLAALHRSAPPPGLSGLGLWIVRQLVAAEGGTITALRTTRGLAVRVDLPATRRRRSAAGAAADTAAGTIPDTAAGTIPGAAAGSAAGTPFGVAGRPAGAAG